MKPPGRTSRWVLLALLLAQVTGCASWSSVPLAEPPGPLPSVGVGEMVRVTRHDGSATDLRVVAVWPDSLRGAMRFLPDSLQTIPAREITRLERFDERSGKTLGIFAGAILGIALFLQAMDDS